MSDLLDRLRKAARSAQESDESSLFVAGGQEVACPQCGHDRFDEGRVLLNSTLSTLLDLEWADRPATILICSRCGRIEWFLRRPERR